MAFLRSTSAPPSFGTGASTNDIHLSTALPRGIRASSEPITRRELDFANRESTPLFLFSTSAEYDSHQLYSPRSPPRSPDYDAAPYYHGYSAPAATPPLLSPQRQYEYPDPDDFRSSSPYGGGGHYGSSSGSGTPAWAPPFSAGSSYEDNGVAWGGENRSSEDTLSSSSFGGSVVDAATSDDGDDDEGVSAWGENFGRLPSAAELARAKKERQKDYAKMVLYKRTPTAPRLESGKSGELYDLSLKKRYTEMSMALNGRPKTLGRHRVLKRSRLVKELYVGKDGEWRRKTHKGKMDLTVPEFDPVCVCGCLAKQGTSCNRFKAMTEEEWEQLMG